MAAQKDWTILGAPSKPTALRAFANSPLLHFRVFTMFRFAAIGTLFILLQAGAMARPAHFPQIRPLHPVHLRGECKQDRIRFCPKAKAANGELLDCYYNHRAQLSAACRNSVSTLLAAWEQHKIQEAFRNPQPEKPAVGKPASTPPKSSQTVKPAPPPPH